MSYLSKGRLCPKKAFVILCYRTLEINNSSPLVGMLRGQLDYWFSKKPQGFYKFLEPCKHPLYKQGDSWSEELGLSRRVFNSTFDAIGVRYKTKTEFMNAKDKFQGKFYASYHDRKKNQTFFVRNPELLQQSKETSESYKSSLKHSKSESEISKKSEFLNQKIKTEEKRGLSTSNCRSKNDTNSRSYTGNSGGTIGGKKNTSENTSSSSLSPTSLSSTTNEKKKIANDMKNIWNEEIGEVEVSHLTSTLISRLNYAYTAIFQSSLENWQVYCRKIASSKFLMGEGRNNTFQKVWLTWAIKPESYERIQAGEFTLGDRKIVLSKEQQTIEAEKAIEETKKEILELPKHPQWIETCLLLTERVGGYAAKYLKELDLSYKGHIAELKASSMFYRDYIQRNLQKEIHYALEEIIGTKINHLRFTV
jgi:hypothetical protein